MSADTDGAEQAPLASEEQREAVEEAVERLKREMSMADMRDLIERHAGGLGDYHQAGQFDLDAMARLTVAVIGRREATREAAQ